MQPKHIAFTILICVFCAGAVVAAVFGASQTVSATNAGDVTAVVTPVPSTLPEAPVTSPNAEPKPVTTVGTQTTSSPVEVAPTTTPSAPQTETTANTQTQNATTATTGITH